MRSWNEANTKPARLHWRERLELMLMSKGRSNKLASQLGEYLVCAELARRGLIATPFSGNVPTFDVLATNESCHTVPIQVKASRSDNWPSIATRWMRIDFERVSGKQTYKGPVKLPTPDLVWVCVAIAKPSDRDRFFILTEADVQRICITRYKEFMKKRGWKRPRKPASLDCRWWIVDLENKFEDNWKLIQDRLL